MPTPHRSNITIAIAPCLWHLVAGQQLMHSLHSHSPRKRGTAVALARHGQHVHFDGVLPVWNTGRPTTCMQAAAEPSLQSYVMHAGEHAETAIKSRQALPLAYNQIRYVQGKVPNYCAGLHTQPVQPESQLVPITLPHSKTVNGSQMGTDMCWPSQHHQHPPICMAHSHGYTTPTQHHTKLACAIPGKGTCCRYQLMPPQPEPDPWAGLAVDAVLAH